MIRLKVKNQNGEDVAIVYLEADGGEVKVKDDISSVRSGYKIEFGEVGQLSAMSGAPLSINVAVPTHVEPNINEIAKSINKEIRRSMLNGGMM